MSGCGYGFRRKLHMQNPSIYMKKSSLNWPKKDRIAYEICGVAVIKEAHVTIIGSCAWILYIVLYQCFTHQVLAAEKEN